MTDLQIAGWREQPLERDQLVAQRCQVVCERRLLRGEAVDDLVPAPLGAEPDRCTTRRTRARLRERPHAVNGGEKRADRRGIEPRAPARARRPIRIARAPAAFESAQDPALDRSPHGGHRDAGAPHRLLVDRVSERLGRILILVQQLHGPGAGRRHEPPDLSLLATRDRPAKLGAQRRTRTTLRSGRRVARARPARQLAPSMRSSAAPTTVSASIPKCA